MPVGASDGQTRQSGRSGSTCASVPTMSSMRERRVPEVHRLIERARRCSRTPRAVIGDPARRSRSRSVRATSARLPLEQEHDERQRRGRRVVAHCGRGRERARDRSSVSTADASRISAMPSTSSPAIWQSFQITAIGARIGGNNARTTVQIAAARARHRAARAAGRARRETWSPGSAASRAHPGSSDRRSPTARPSTGG